MHHPFSFNTKKLLQDSYRSGDLHIEPRVLETGQPYLTVRIAIPDTIHDDDVILGFKREINAMVAQTSSGFLRKGQVGETALTPALEYPAGIVHGKGQCTFGFDARGVNAQRLGAFGIGTDVYLALEKGAQEAIAKARSGYRETVCCL